ncbi:hypothetical protein QBC43DRAFT_314776 [Cladorrhinum sp. PSN259]|nr:hypothetical protein QBC43DRAFT_314776 [Cladorrhinum sp. PSN259]
MDSDDIMSGHAHYTPVPIAMRPLQQSMEENDEDDAISSNGSHYSQEVSSSSAYEEEDEEDEVSQDDYEDADPEQDGADQPLLTSKRPLRSSTPSDRPLKRPKPAAPFHQSYLNILNDDILDAASGFIPEEINNTELFPPLYPSQIGLTHWSVPEKTLFFTALSRLGRDDPLGISRRINTKSELEVADYLRLLQAASRSERKLLPSEMPASLALSPALCTALESFADTIASKQQHYEDALEASRWNSSEQNWVINPSNRKEIESSPPEGVLSLALFRVRTWLRLQERIFMNSIVEDYQWETFASSSSSYSSGAGGGGGGGDGAERPGIRVTCLEDFYNIVVSLTRRLVASSIYVAESRIKSKGHEAKNIIWRKDVRAAAASIGLKRDSRLFWAKCARRLRLEVWDEERKEVMGFDEAERALGALGVSDLQEPELVDEGKDEEEEGGEGEGEEEQEQEGEEEEASAMETDGSEDENDEAERRAIKVECDELLHYSALEVPDSKKDRDSLRQRIQLERAEEAYADKLDLKVSYDEERRLWAMLGQSPPVEIPKIEMSEQRKNPKQGKTVEELIKGFSRIPGGDDGDWRSRLEEVPSRWEMDYKLVEEEGRVKIVKRKEGVGLKEEGKQNIE